MSVPANVGGNGWSSAGFCFWACTFQFIFIGLQEYSQELQIILR